ncbi:MAG TPA: hypothetical protein VGM58_09645 [Verrucomicrobiae bacterium]
MRYKRWPIVLSLVFLSFLVLMLGTYLGRERLKQAVIAYEIHQMHIFTPPSERHHFLANAEFYWDIAGIRVARDKRLKELGPEFKSLMQEVNKHQNTGEQMEYSTHIYREIRWRLNFTDDIAATKARMEDLRQSLTQPELQKQATEQQASDGSWAMGINVWYLRLYYSVEMVEDGLHGQIPKYPLSFLDRINSPEKLTAQLDADLRDDFTKTGMFNREETDETFSALARLLLETKNPPYAFDPGLKAALLEFVKLWQNPVTGCWGQWMVDRRGRIWKMDDVGMTFHVVSDLQGQVEHLDLITKRVLQLDGVNFPAGIRMNGHYENHLNWDAVIIFRQAWPTLDDATKEQCRAEISRMLDWCLADSYQPDGSFKTSDIDDTLVDACSYGNYFLNDIGFYDKKKRFWTDKDFPEAAAIHEHIKAKLKSLGILNPD